VRKLGLAAQQLLERSKRLAKTPARPALAYVWGWFRRVGASLRSAAPFRRSS
jgi:hypothetical protein